MTTRRTTLRRSFRLPLSLGRKLPALTADVSRGGFSAELPQVFVPGSKVHGFFLLEQQEINFAGTVAWAVPGDPQAQVYSRIGVRFDEMPEPLRALFNNLASERRPRRLKKK
ncbi:MAG: PilZ domain-containing protein [Myxococcaceae bacterium]